MKENPLTALNGVETTRVLQAFNEWVATSPSQPSSLDQLRKIISDRGDALQSAPLTLLEYPAKELETPTQEVTVFDLELRHLVEDMFETMRAYKGIGLAANQVGVLQKVLVIAVGGDYANMREFINPEIVSREGKITWQEGCLSFPTYFEFIDRARKITVRAQDLYGTWFEFECEDITAVCLQHEIDHLQGITFLERMSHIKRNNALRRLKSYERDDKRR